MNEQDAKKVKQLHKKWRRSFREGVFKRDKNQCKFCNCTTELDAHHITDRHDIPNGGYVISNGITLCSVHHMDAEMYHQTHGKSGIDGFYPNDLYRSIGSSYEKAYADSKNLILGEL